MCCGSGLTLRWGGGSDLLSGQDEEGFEEMPLFLSGVPKWMSDGILCVAFVSKRSGRAMAFRAWCSVYGYWAKRWHSALCCVCIICSKAVALRALLSVCQRRVMASCALLSVCKRRAMAFRARVSKRQRGIPRFAVCF